MYKDQWTESLKERDRWRELAIEGIIIILVNNQLDALFQCIYLFIYFTSLHVSSNPVLIIRRINCVNTSSGMYHSVILLMMSTWLLETCREVK